MNRGNDVVFLVVEKKRHKKYTASIPLFASTDKEKFIKTIKDKW